MGVGSEIGALAGAGERTGSGGGGDVAAPVNSSLPVITGTARVGQSLSTSNGSWTSGTTPTYAYQWQRGSSDISGANASSYTLVSADLGSTIRVIVTATNTIGSTPATSSNTASVTEVAPVNTVLPAISGTEQVGSTLTISNGSWTSIATPTYSYQWERTGSPIGSATASSYVLVEDDEGETLTCVVTATNSGGGTAAESAATGTVAAAPAGPSHSIELNGTSQYLSLSNSNWGSYNRAKFAIAGSFRQDISGFDVIMSRYAGGGSNEWYLSVGGNGSVNFDTPDAAFNSVASAAASGQWNAFLLHYDSANATSGDRIKIWLNNSGLSSSFYLAPTAAVPTHSIDTKIGVYTPSSKQGYFDGLIYSLAFFSGTLPAAGDVFDGTSGKLKDLSALSGLYSLLDTVSGSVISDAVRPDWTNNGTVTASTSKP